MVRTIFRMLEMPGIKSPSILLCFAIGVRAVSVTAESTTSSDHNRSGGVIGNYYNHWIYSDGVYDLTRSDVMNVTEPKRLTNMLGSRKTAIIEPSRTALVMIDMQNFFLHPALAPDATAGRSIVNTTVNTVKSFREANIKTLWVNWGIDDFDLLTMPPPLLSDFSNASNSMSSTFGSDMGEIDGIRPGRLLWRGAWNSRLYGPLDRLYTKGAKLGTDLWFHKNRQSGLWGAQTPLGLWLQENQITTLFLGGVNIDQCVWGTLLDAFYRGLDVILVPDLSATTSPFYATQMVYYNTDARGFLANSTQILESLAK